MAARREHVLRASPERVFEMLANRGQVLRWRKTLAVAQPIDAQTLRVRDVHGEEWIEHVEDATAPAYLRLVVFGMNDRPLYEVSFMLAPAPEGTRVTARYRARGRSWFERFLSTLRTPTYKRAARERILMAQAALKRA